MDEERKSNIDFAFVVAIIGWLIAAFLNKPLGTAIFCVAGIYLGLKYLIMAIRLEATSQFERLEKLGMALFFVVYTYTATKVLLTHGLP
jgi:hypothetical protein